MKVTLLKWGRERVPSRGRGEPQKKKGMNMKHFALEDWADFARQVIDSERKAAMQRHLDEGCEDCRKAMLMWRNVSEISSREAAYQPPESSIRVAKAYFAAYGSYRQPSPFTKIARLTLDTSGQAVPSGI